MDETLIIHIEIGNLVLADEELDNFILKVPRNISWADFELMLKLTYDEDILDICYYDDENDLIKLSSDEELVLAFQYAVISNNNTLRLKLSAGIPRLNITAVEETAIVEPSNFIPVENSSHLKPDIMVANISPETNVAKIESPEEVVIVSCGSDTNCSDFSDVESLTPDKEYLSRQYFTLKNKSTELTLGLATPSDELMFYVEEDGKLYDPDQLFYEDLQSCTIRSYSNDLCLDLYSNFASVQSYNPDRMSQAWVIQGDR